MIKCGITGSSGNLGNKFINEHKSFKFIKFTKNITVKKDVENWILNNDFDLILHFAAIVPVNIVKKNYKKAFEVNYLGTKNLLKSIEKKNKKNLKLKWFFFSSTSHVYQFSKSKISEKAKTIPISLYGDTKLRSEKLVTSYSKKIKNINFCIGRVFSIIDNKSEFFFLNNLKKKICEQNIVKFKNLNHYRDFLDTKEISKIIFFLWKRKFRGIINIASGKKTSLFKIANLVAKKYKKKIYVKKNNDVTICVGNINKLKKMGYKLKNLKFAQYL